jgi:site-specific DNA-methyltransferase (adenine-specific)
MAYMKDQPDNSFDLAIVDPPYGIGMSGGNVGYKGFNDLERKEWDSETPDQIYFCELMRVSKDQIIWGGNYFILPPTRCFLIWDKGAGFKGRTFAECEQAWTSFDANAKIYQRDPLCNGDYKGKIHPTQKPVKLYDWLLSNYAKPDQRILDTHLGSGSSAIAAHYFGCDFVGMEIDEDYYRSACERFDRETRQIAMF